MQFIKIISKVNVISTVSQSMKVANEWSNHCDEHAKIELEIKELFTSQNILEKICYWTCVLEHKIKFSM